MSNKISTKFIFVGLGNPGLEYKLTRHNVGRYILGLIAERNGFLEWEEDKTLESKLSEGTLMGEEVEFVLPNTFMNKSGNTVKKMIHNKKDLSRLIIVHDDIDLPLGIIKISKGKGDGGHNGIDSIIKSIGTKIFIRIRVGICPSKRGKREVEKPSGEREVLDFVLGPFKKPEVVEVSRVSLKVEQAMHLIATEGLGKAMNVCNTE